MERITYLPWSRAVFDECKQGWQEGNLPSIDLELTAKCSHGKCIYCDSGDLIGEAAPNEVNLEATLVFLEDAITHGLKYVHSCGLGEPLDDPRIIPILRYLGENGVHTSMFTNGLKIDKEMAQFLKDNNVSLILKLDTFNEEWFDKLLGKVGAARKIYAALDHLLNVGYGSREDGLTNLAFSIVPTKVSLYDIEEVIEFAKKHNIFPSIGELETAGRSTRELYNELSLTDEEIQYVRDVVNDNLWLHYKRPICPAIMTSLHVDNLGGVIVDRKTGLSCKWFLLKDPDVISLGNIKETNVAELINMVRNYRQKCFATPGQLDHCNIDYEFGGCGGNPRDIIREAKEML